MMGWGYAGGRWAEREPGEIVCSILDNDILVKEPTSRPMSGPPLSTAESVGTLGIPCWPAVLGTRSTRIFMPEADDRAAQVRSAFASAPSSHGDPRTAALGARPQELRATPPWLAHDASAPHALCLSPTRARSLRRMARARPYEMVVLAHVSEWFSGCRAPLNTNSTLFYRNFRGAYR